MNNALAFSLIKGLIFFIYFNYFELIIGVEEDDLKWEESKIHEDASDLNLLDIIKKCEDHLDLMPPQNSRYDILTYYQFSMAFVLIMLSVLEMKGLYMFRSPVHLQVPISGQLQGSSL